MINETIIPKGSRVIMKEATIFDAKNTLVVENYKVVELSSIKGITHGPRFGDQKIIARMRIYQFFIEIREIVVGASGFYGRSPVKPVTVKWVGDRPDVNDKSKKYRWVTFEFIGGKQKTVLYNSVTLNQPMLIPLEFDMDLYRSTWSYYKLRKKFQNIPKQLVGSYYNTETIDGILYANNPIYPRQKSEEELLMEMEPVNKARLLEKYKKEREYLDWQIEILERKKS